MTSDQPVSGPVQQCYSKAQFLERAKEFMVLNFGHPPQLEPEQRDKFYERLGLLSLYIDHIWEPFNG